MKSKADQQYRLLKIVMVSFAAIVTCMLYMKSTVYPEDILNIPLGIGITNPDEMIFLNSILRPYDVIAVRPRLLNALYQVKEAKRALIFGVRDYKNASTLINKALERGASIIGYNLEGPYTIDEMDQPLENWKNTIRISHYTQTL